MLKLRRLPWAAALGLLLAGCGAEAALVGSPPKPPPLPEGMAVAFNHNPASRYRSPIDGRWRQGDDLEAFVLASIAGAEREILVAVQELTLPRIARALVERHRQGLRVRVVLENSYSTPWSEQHLADLSPRERHRRAQLEALGGGDAVALLRDGGIPVIDDTADGSAGSGLMHHKFMVIDGREVLTGSTNFTSSCIHGDPDDASTRGNVNHMLRLHSQELAALFREEFERLWGSGPLGGQGSRFGLAKESAGLRWVRVGSTPVGVLFTPHRMRDERNGLQLLAELLQQAETRLDLALFVFSDQRLGNVVGDLHARGVAVRLLADPGFANRFFSEVLDLLGLELPDHRCIVQAGNRPLDDPLPGVGTPRLAGGDKLHHKLAVIDRRRVITGSFNWSPAAAHTNDETLLVIDSPRLAAHFGAEVDRLWKGAELGITERLQRKQQRMLERCGSGRRAAA
ncbi:phosphatidylserine/phosphatidylglycerophosphate/cardiolipin synthase family protein [Cyanobium sp. CH-040]|uniref:phospholipase D-like domain-containing protein n=1 Tax=Cyanobium sp. CH-040 TaxID=2823708 RepID=UPI0020CB6C10|nr:phospholipase D-like domain-containing protein [Cyanobium sp. CH-040]MCP9927259.1 phospholipase [Cyanobium sp. CH-040]